jgi:hypothetical protein
MRRRTSRHSLFRGKPRLRRRRRLRTLTFGRGSRLSSRRFGDRLSLCFARSRSRNFLGFLYRFSRFGTPGNRAEMPPDLFRDIFVDRAGMRLLLGNTELRQDCNNRAVRLFAFSRQLVNPDFLHIYVQLIRLTQDTKQ